MSQISYENPIIVKDDIRPAPIANKGFPYNELADDRAYNFLDPLKGKKHRAYRLKLIKMFDLILGDYRFRTNAEYALEKIIG